MFIFSQLESVLSSSQAAVLLQLLYSLVRRLSLALGSVAAQTALTAALVDAFMPTGADQQAALSAAQVSFAVGLVTNATACLDKSSTLFEDISSATSGLGLCVHYALKSVRIAQSVSSLNVFASSSLVDFGAAQLLAVVLNKARVEAQCEALLTQVVATLHEMDTHQDPAAVPVYVQLLLWAVRAVSMRPNLKPSTQNAPVASFASWQEYLAHCVVSRLTAPAEEDGPNGTYSAALRLQLASSLHILTADHEVVLSLTLRLSATTSSLFWKQKLWSRTFGPLSQSQAKTAADEADHSVVSQLPVLSLLAICALVAGMPTNILQDSMKALVSIVVMAVSRSQSPSADAADAADSTDADTASALAQQSLRTLETLLNHDAQLFVPYLNIIVPALMEVEHSIFLQILCMQFFIHHTLF